MQTIRVFVGIPKFIIKKMYGIPKFVIEKPFGIPKSLLSTLFSPRQNLEKSAEGFENCFSVLM